VTVDTGAAGQPNFFASVIAYFRLWRYESKGVVLCFISMYLGWIALAGGLERPLDDALRIVAATAAGTAILLAIFLINDAADREIDRIVHPERPIPQGRSAWQHIYGLGLFLLAAGVALALVVGGRFPLAIGALALLAALHYGYLKHRLTIPCSSELITPAMSALFPISAFAIAAQPPAAVLLAVAAFIYFADLGQDMLGGVHDQEGDRRQNVRTFALAIGARATLLLSLASFVLSLVAGWLVYAWAALGWLYLAVFAALAIVMASHYARLLRAGDSELPLLAGKANHFGGFYFFIASAAILPDYLLRRLFG
jgi:4-hydroxybenzoate polyprenyltransferase